MPTFREVLKDTIPSKTQRLIKRIEDVVKPRIASISRRRENVINFLRDNQRIQGFVQPKSFSISGHQTKTKRFFDRIVGSISRFIRRVRPQVGFLDIRTPSARLYRDALNKLIERSKNSLINNARDLIDQRITISEFRQALTRIIRTLHVSAAFIGVRGVGNITPNVLEVIQARISKQLNFLNDFTQDIQEIFDKGQELTPKQADQIINSAGRYASSAKATASDAERQLLKDTYGDAEDEDRVMAMRVLGAAENHCMVCPQLANHWVDLDELVPIGDTPCGEHCYCSIVYARASDIAGENLPTDTRSLIL